MTNNAWKIRHDAAMRNPQGFEKPIVMMVTALKLYAEMHNTRYESRIGPHLESDPISDGWRDMAIGLLSMLCGELGRLDAGTIDAMVRDLAAENDVNLE